MDLATGKLTPLTDLKGMMLYKVTSVAFDPDSRTAFYTDQNYAFRELMAIDVDTGRKRRLLTDARIGDLAFNHADKSLWGIRHQNGFVDHRPHPAALHRASTRSRRSAMARSCSTSTSRPTGSWSRPPTARSTASSRSGCGSASDLEQGDADEPVATLDAGAVDARRISPSRPDGKALLGNSYYTGVSNVFRFDIATGKYEVLTNASTGFFRPQLRPDGSLLVYEYTGEGFNPSIVQPQVREDLGTVGFLGTEVVNDASRAQAMGRRLARQGRRSTQLITAARHLRPDRADALRRPLSDRLGLRAASRRSAITSTSPTRCSSAS